MLICKLSMIFLSTMVLETYFCVFGVTSQGEEVAVLIPEASSTVYVYSLAQGISQEEAQAIAKKKRCKPSRANYSRFKGWQTYLGSQVRYCLLFS